MRFTHLFIEGYRSLANTTLPLHPLTVMIGPNGTGKTSILEVFQLLKDGAEENLATHLEKLGGLNAVLSRTGKGAERLKISLTTDVEDTRSRKPMNYRFELTPREIGYTISFERLEWQWDPQATRPYRYIDVYSDNVYYADPDAPGAPVTPSWPYNRAELALAQVPRMYQEPEGLRGALSKTQFYSFLDVGYRSVVRLPQALTPTKRPGMNGENLYSALYNLRALQPDTYDRVEEVLRVAFPGFRRLEFPVVGAGHVTMTWYQSELTGPIYPGELSEGTLRFLWLATVLLTADPPPITLIDEPEVSLHPELLKLLAGLLQDASIRGQVIVATHSSDLIRWLRPDEIVILDKIDGQTQFTWADSMNLTEWLKEYTLSDLWLMGTLGGRP